MLEGYLIQTAATEITFYITIQTIRSDQAKTLENRNYMDFNVFIIICLDLCSTLLMVHVSICSKGSKDLLVFIKNITKNILKNESETK